MALGHISKLMLSNGSCGTAVMPSAIRAAVTAAPPLAEFKIWLEEDRQGDERVADEKATGKTSPD